MKYIASCSFGKDSLAMVLMLIERDLPLDEVAFYDTGMEFQAIYDLRDAMLPIFQRHGIKYTTLPSPGDYIFYDWQDGSNYAATNNTGSADHVGIVVSCDGKTIKVIEGNMSDAVGYRKLAVNGRYIRGFGVPKYASKATSAPSGGGEAPTPGKDEKPTPGLAVGSVVTFTGTKHYISSMAVNGKSCKPGEAKVTAVAKSGKHPYHLIKTTGSSSTVYGWVDAADVKVMAPAIVKGSKVKVAKGAKTYNGGGLASYVYTTTYTVIQIDGSRVVIGLNGVVTAAVNIKDLTLVG